MTTITEDFLSAISIGLQRKSVTTCSRWAEKYRMMSTPFPGPWRFDHHPWLLEMHDADDDLLVGQKSSQMGYTEWALNKTFYHMDILHHDVLYILPSSDDASDFSSGRFDPALELSPHLRHFFADVNNVALKRAGSNVLYVRGSRSRSKLKSIPTPLIIMDELDEMEQKNIPLAEQRQSGQMETTTLKLSTPTIDDYGINREFKLSSQDHFFFKCPSCSRYTELVYPDCLEITAESMTDENYVNSFYKCKECKQKLEHKDKISFLKHKQRGGNAHFVPQKLNPIGRGFYINRLYSMVKAGQPDQIAFEALKARTDPTYAQEFHNSILGNTYAEEGSKVNDKQITQAIIGYHKGATDTTNCKTLGIDIGAVLHIVVLEWEIDFWNKPPGLSVNDVAKPKLLLDITSSGKANDFDEAYTIFKDYRCHAGVTDAEPERRAAMQFAQKIWGRIYLCDYAHTQTGKEITIHEEEATLKVNRTAWLDLSLGRFRNGTIKLPVDTSIDFKKQVKEPVRVIRIDKYGNPYGVYVNVGADHYAHALTYAEIALPLAMSVAANVDIKSYL